MSCTCKNMRSGHSSNVAARSHVQLKFKLGSYAIAVCTPQITVPALERETRSRALFHDFFHGSQQVAGCEAPS